MDGHRTLGVLLFTRVDGQERDGRAGQEHGARGDVAAIDDSPSPPTPSDVLFATLNGQNKVDVVRAL